MKIKNGFILRKLGNEYMAVAVGEAGKAFSGMIRMNDAGAWLWNQLKEEITKEALIENMCAYYDNLTAETAKADLEEFLAAVAPAIEA